jgi:hypothetical protein
MRYLAHRPRLCCLAVLLFALAGGCGVHEYEKKMLDSQIRLQRWEEEGKVLGSPFNVPTRKNAEGDEESIVNLFLRLPKNLENSPETDKRGTPIQRNNLLYVYKEGSPGPVSRFELAVGDQKDFATDVLRLCPGKVTTRQTSYKVAGRENPTNFETFEVTTEGGDKYFYSINIWNGSTKVALVYWILKGKEAAGKQLVEASLQTFGGDKEASVQRDLFRRGSPVDRVPAENR